MTDTTAKIRPKGTDGTGITEDDAAELFQRVGSHLMAIVDLQVVDHKGPSLKGKRVVELVIDGIEPAFDDDLADHLRELQRTVYLNRTERDGQATIDSTLGDERTVADVVSAGQRHRPHPFLPDDAAKDTPICDVCGLVEATPLHSTQDVLPDDEDDQDDDGDEDQGDDEPDPEEDEDTHRGTTVLGVVSDPFTPAAG